MFRRELNKTRTMRKLGMFNYPHTFDKVNPSSLRIPTEDRYAQINRKYNEGDYAELAYQNVRKYPDWYKPYMFNYYGHGYLALYFFFMALYGWSYIQEICKVKGRRKLTNYDHKDCVTIFDKMKSRFTKERIAAGDEQYARYLRPKERNLHH